MNTIKKFFVYGTLRKGANLPDNLKFIAETDKYQLTYYNAYLPNSKLYMDQNKEYPIIVHDKEIYSSEDIVKGNIIESTNFEETLKNFDMWEDYPINYNRKEIEAINIDKGNIKENAILYIGNDKLNISMLHDINCNDYFEYLKRIH